MNKRIIDFNYFLYTFTKVTGFIPVMLFLRPKFIYASKENKKNFKKDSCIVASNHSHFTDPFIMVSSLYFKRISIVASVEICKNKFMAFLFKYFFKTIPIDKNKISLSTFKKASKVINDSHSVGIFPEGTVAHKEDELIEFKSGVIMMSLMTKAPIYPMYIVKRKSIFNRQKIYVGEKFDTANLLLSCPNMKEKLKVGASLLYEKEKELELKASSNN